MTPTNRYHMLNREERLKKMSERYHNRPDVIAKKAERERLRAEKEAKKAQEKKEKEASRILRDGMSLEQKIELAKKTSKKYKGADAQTASS
jgi:hypothetical protein